MKMLKTLLVTTRKEWRTWLTKNHNRETEVWLIFHKKDSGKPRLPYDDAVEEALCFGWIDSLVQRMDDEKYAQKFTPRKPASKWSDSNRARVQKLIKAGLMTKAGAAVLEKQRAESREQKAENGKLKAEATEPAVPLDVRKAVKAAGATAEFKALPPGYLRMCMKWIDAAKRAETREKRIQEFVELTAKNERIGLK